jgi:hypothetical protein
MEMFQGDSPKRLAQGAVVGVVLTILLGFNTLGFGFGWRTSGSAATLATVAANDARSKALLPFCVAEFNKSATPEQVAALKAAASYNRVDVVRQVVKFPGSDSLEYSLGRSCGEEIIAAGEKRAEKS